jgi:hypothetical protein
MEREVKSPPASPWERDRVSSIRGRIGEKIVRLEKLRKKRPQKMKRGRSFIISLASNEGAPDPGAVIFSLYPSSS